MTSKITDDVKHYESEWLPTICNHCVNYSIDATISLEMTSYTFGEGDGTVQVCSEISGVPSGGVECDIVVTFSTKDGTKAGKMSLSYFATLVKVSKLYY